MFSLRYLLYASFYFSCKTTAMFNRFVSIYGSIVVKTENRADRTFLEYFLNMRFPQLILSC